MKYSIIFIIFVLFATVFLVVKLKMNETKTAVSNTAATTVEGTAQNAKAGAVVVTSDNKVIYIEGLDTWPLADTRKHVIVTGTLVEKKIIPDPMVNSKGEISQGAEGSQTVMKHATWKITE